MKKAILSWRTKKVLNPDADTSWYREDIPLTEDIDTYFEREIKPFNPGAWIDKAKTKLRTKSRSRVCSYKYVAPVQPISFALKIKALEESIVRSFEQLSGQDVKVRWVDRWKKPTYLGLGRYCSSLGVVKFPKKLQKTMPTGTLLQVYWWVLLWFWNRNGKIWWELKG